MSNFAKRLERFIHNLKYFCTRKTTSIFEISAAKIAHDIDPPDNLHTLPSKNVERRNFWSEGDLSSQRGKESFYARRRCYKYSNFRFTFYFSRFSNYFPSFAT